MRRSTIAAVAIGGSLALASSAAAIQIPMGTSSDAPYSGSGTPSSIYSLLNGAYDGLSKGDSALVQLGDTAVPQTMPTKAALTATQAQQIAADFTDTTINGTTPSSSGWKTALSTPGPAYDSNYATDAAQIGGAGTSWAELSGLVANLGSVSSVLNSADSATVSSSGTITAVATPFAYNITVSAPSGGYILPSAFTLTFPAGLSVNTALVSAEVNAAANGTTAADIAAIEANPSGTSIGTVTLTSPVADEFGGTNNQLVGKVYVVTTGASSGQGSATQPYFELWFAQGIYALGSFPSVLTFPLTVQFGEAVTPIGTEPLPLSSLAISFPAATSPVKSASCSTLGTVTATATDAVGALAYEFGDKADGVSTAGGTASPVNLIASAATVTNKCVTNTIRGNMGALTTGHPTMTLKVKTTTAFGTVTVGLPKGLSFVKSTKLAKQVKAAGAKVKAVRIAGGKLVIALKSKVKSVTIKTVKPLISETAALVKSIKKHKTKKLSVSVHAGTIAMTASIKA